MDPISIAVAIIGALANSGVVPTVIKGLAGMLGGPSAVDVAGKVIDTAHAAFGTTDPEKIKLLIAQDATARDRYVAELQAETEQFKAQTVDVQDARKRDLTIHETAGTNLRANIMVGAAFAYLIGATTFIFFFITELSSTGSVAVLTFLTTTMGNVTAMLAMAFSFEFGSSRGSSEKSNQMAELLAAKK